MPLLGTKFHILNSTVKKDRKSKQSEASPQKCKLHFVIEHTQEICNDEIEFLRKTTIYKERIWTCRLTGRLNLTHKEAMKSEQCNIKNLKKTFPKCFEKSVLDIVHHTTESLENLVHKCFLTLHEEYSINEPVILKVKAAGKEIKGIIVKVDKTDEALQTISGPTSSPSNSDKENGAKSPKKGFQLPEKKPYKYSIKLIDQDKIVSKVPASEIIREFRPPSKDTIKMYIRAKAMRYGTNYTGPWIVDDDIIKKHKIMDKNSNFALDKEKMSQINLENEIEALARIEDSASGNTPISKKNKQISSERKCPFKMDITQMNEKKLKQSTLFDMATANGKKPGLASPMKNIGKLSFTPSRITLPPLGLRLVKLVKEGGGKESTITQLVTKCAQVFTEKHISLLPSEIRERVRQTQEKLIEKRKLLNMTPEERQSYNKQKREDARLKMLETVRQKKLRYEDTNLELTALPQLQLVNMPADLPSKYFGRAVMITEFIHSYRSLFIPEGDELLRTFEASAELLLEALCAGQRGFKYVALVMVVMLRTLLQDGSTEWRREIGTPLSEIPLNICTASEMLRLILRPAEKKKSAAQTEPNAEVEHEDAIEEDDIENEQVKELFGRLEHCDFFKLSLEEKFVLLEGLVQRLLNCNIINDHMESCAEKVSGAWKKRILMLKKRNDQLKVEKEEMKAEKEKSVAKKADESGSKLVGSSLAVAKSSVNEEMQRDLASVVKNRRAQAKQMSEQRELREKEEKLRREKELERARVELAVASAEKHFEETSLESRLTVRKHSLGCDRFHRRYFLFASASPGIYVEDGWLSNGFAINSGDKSSFDPDVVETTWPTANKNTWFILSDLNSVQQLMAALHPLGAREGALRAELNKVLEGLRRQLKQPVSKPLLDDNLNDSSSDLLTEGLRSELLESESRLRAGGLGGVPNFERWQRRVSDPTCSRPQFAAALLEMFNHVDHRFYFGAFKAKPVPKSGISPDKEATGSTLLAKETSPWLDEWRSAVEAAPTCARLNFLLAVMDAGVNWDKSVEHAKCRICRKKGEDSKLLLCDACNAAFHIYCLRPALTRVPSGDWFCIACIPTLKRERKNRGAYREESDADNNLSDNDASASSADEQKNNCAVCESDKGVMVTCSSCSCPYHLSCHEPALRNLPRGDWVCNECRGVCEMKASRSARSRRLRSRPADRQTVESLDAATSEEEEEESSSEGNESPIKKRVSSSRNASAKLTRSKRKSASSDTASSDLTDDEKPNASIEKSSRLRKGVVKIDDSSNDEEQGTSSAGRSSRSSRIAKRKAFKQEDSDSEEDDSTDDTNCSESQQTNQKVGKKEAVVSKVVGERKKCKPAAGSSKEESDEEDESETLKGRKSASRGRVDVGKRARLSTSNQQNGDEPPCKRSRLSANSSGPSWLRTARSLHEQLMRHRCACDFLDPVTLEDAPDYNDIIKHPTDLSSMEARLRQTYGFESMEAYLSEVALMFDNAFEYNPPGSETLKDARQLIKYFRSRLDAQAPEYTLYLKTSGL